MTKFKNTVWKKNVWTPVVYILLHQALVKKKSRPQASVTIPLNSSHKRTSGLGKSVFKILYKPSTVGPFPVCGRIELGPNPLPALNSLGFLLLIHPALGQILCRGLSWSMSHVHLARL